MFIASTLVILTLTISSMPQPAGAAPPPGAGESVEVPASHQPQANTGSSETCLMCHSDPDFKGAFQNKDLLPLFVSNGEYEQSVHGTAGLACVACHTNISQYPHHEKQEISCQECHGAEGGKANSFSTLRVELPYQNRRELTLAANEACRTCHQREYEVASDSAHVKVLNGGNTSTPVCVDCHGSHNISKPDQPRQKISQTCSNCHLSVYTSYQSSVHGRALADDSNPDVPTCVDCHGVHSVRGPRDPTFRNDSITICGGCHNNQALMAKYGISTSVFNTYLDDFHGRTVDLLRRQESGMPSNTAVCFDCHGVHNIRRPSDSLSSVYPTNLQHTCQQCHKEANITFPDAWLSHYLPTWKNTPALFSVNLIYSMLIPFTLGFFILYIGLDARKRWVDRHQILNKALSEEKSEDDFTRND